MILEAGWPCELPLSIVQLLVSDLPGFSVLLLMSRTDWNKRTSSAMLCCLILLLTSIRLQDLCLTSLVCAAVLL